MKKYFLLIIGILPYFSFSQSDFEKTIQAGSVLVNGLSFLKGNKFADNKTSLMLCIKNKLSDKITFKITGKDKDDNDVKKDMVIQNNGKECLFEIPKGVYTYEVILANKDIFKKGEYKFDGDITITIKKDE
ncbi:hypothetical protein EZL74_00030 [Flavobacterium silvisoli]|uniref:Uncharacterized protein n=1 Tax=Flavobacterium silvisoli TaxID=2529433 RepID=A0A4Q9Z3F8_9FLAO|nr:hypothetical protein [Flavobacterium silvisoli]TBX70923.1 hypothetical protein EZL74_00030 [Flavobacterium silvisoli]